jgi:hypothetical protein
MSEDLHAGLFRRLYKDRLLAHEVIFRHRHPNATQPFHRAIIADWHDMTIPRLVDMAFRGSAKSTLAEEAIALRAGFREFRNGLIIGETYDRACERLHAIRHEVDSNERLEELFGPLVGPVWSDGELILSNGVRILALGRGQALRGIKFEDRRPDAVFCDDIENGQSVATLEGRRKVRQWFFTELLPACDPEAFVRVAATPLDPDALAVRLTQTKDWVTKIYPIEFINAEGKREATWPDRFSLEWIDKQKETFTAQGLIDDFEREYLCTTLSRGARTFRDEQFKVEPQVRTWQAVYAMFDPARTVKATSATTGFASWSWIGPKLVVWDAWGKMLMPDEIVTAMFDCGLAQDLPPVWIGVEEDGLNEFLLQPIRSEQVRRGQSIPFRALRAPRGKLDFIRGLQPYFRAGQVSFAKELPDLKNQMLGFPTGRIDVPNALAYALRLRPGAPIHENFSHRHVFEGLRRVHAAAPWLVVNATGSLVAAALCQYHEGALFVLADWVREGAVSDLIGEIAAAAQMEAGRRVTLVAEPKHFDHYNNVGLVQAAARVPLETQRGVPPALGAPVLSQMLQRELRGFPMVRVSSNAHWTLNGFSGGYCRGIKNGVITPTAEDGPYRVLLEGLESFAGLTDAGSLFDEDEGMSYAVTNTGHRYLSAKR